MAKSQDPRTHRLATKNCLRKLTESPLGVSFRNHFIRTGDFPIGLDPKKILDCLQKPEVKTRIATLTGEDPDMKYIIGVDRLDYIKGVPQKLDALDLFFEEHPEWVQKVTMIQVAVPSREDVPEYRNLATQMHRRVDEINVKYGTLLIVLRRPLLPRPPIPVHPSNPTNVTRNRHPNLPTHQPDPPIRLLRGSPRPVRVLLRLSHHLHP